jgi:hypothetical protein
MKMKGTPLISIQNNRCPPMVTVTGEATKNASLGDRHRDEAEGSEPDHFPVVQQVYLPHHVTWRDWLDWRSIRLSNFTARWMWENRGSGYVVPTSAPWRLCEIKRLLSVQRRKRRPFHLKCSQEHPRRGLVTRDDRISRYMQQPGNCC